MIPELSAVGPSSKGVVSERRPVGRNYRERKSVIRFQIICRFHQDPTYTSRLLSRLERLGVSCKAPGLLDFAIGLQEDLVREMRLGSAVSLAATSCAR